MGSILSGWYARRTNRLTTDNCLALDVRYLAREAILKPGQRFTLTWAERGVAVASVGVVVGSGSMTISDTDGHYPIRLEWMPCTLGGRRAFFRCPRCGRRCCLLYGGVRGFACRECLRLAYPVEREGRLDRAERRARKIISRGQYDWNRKDFKPKWMRWATYRRQEDAAEAAVEHIDVRHDYLVGMLRAADARATQPRRGRGRPRKGTFT